MLGRGEAYGDGRLRQQQREPHGLPQQQQHILIRIRFRWYRTAKSAGHPYGMLGLAWEAPCGKVTLK